MHKANFFLQVYSNRFSSYFVIQTFLRICWKMMMMMMMRMNEIISVEKWEGTGLTYFQTPHATNKMPWTKPTHFYLNWCGKIFTHAFNYFIEKGSKSVLEWWLSSSRHQKTVVHMQKNKHIHLFFFDKKTQNLSYSFDIPPIKKYFFITNTFCNFAQIKTCQSLSSLLGLLIVRTVDR